MKGSGSSDHFGSRLQRIAACGTCGSEARVLGGGCLSCLLRAALEPADDAELQSFDSLLAEVDVRDRDCRAD